MNEPRPHPQPGASVSVPMPISLAAAENLSPFFFRTLQTLGLEVVIVRLAVDKADGTYQDAGIELELERELQAIHAGQFDASFFTPESEAHFYHVAKADLGKAIQKLKDALQWRELLPIASLFHVESPTELREWYPGRTAAVIEITEET